MTIENGEEGWKDAMSETVSLGELTMGLLLLSLIIII